MHTGSIKKNKKTQRVWLHVAHCAESEEFKELCFLLSELL